MTRMQDSSGRPPTVGFSEACERNKAPILEVLEKAFSNCHNVLEIGSGTGQHVVHFARSLPTIVWQPTDADDYLPGLRVRLEVENCSNIEAAVKLDVRMSPWPVGKYAGVFSANTLHYMGIDCVEAFFAGVGAAMQPGGVLVVYGPFRYAGQFTSDSNARFDEFLRQSDPVRGIRDFEWVNELAVAQELSLQQDITMPANNQLLVWGKATPM
jgi:cyclopropane fatty-acyl-phospholipid synthase-like methyltransferase